MIGIYCDVCRKKIDNPTTDYYYGDFSVCESCKDNLEYQLKPQLRANDPFSMEWYRKLVNDTFSKAVQKGKS
jgi:hypothetical protein